MSVAHFSSGLLDTAQLYLGLGYSVIPVWGDADAGRPKVAAVEWKPFQHRKPTLVHLQDWFQEAGYGGLAIITGSISGLVVLDFDSPAQFRAFADRYPDLLQTRIVQTRRGDHLYFRLPPHLRLASRKVAGVDLLSDGCYVIAPPTVIDGVEYRVTKGGMPRMLTAADLPRLQAFLDDVARETTGKRVTHEFAPSTRECEAVSEISNPLEAAPQYLLTAADLVALYKGLSENSINIRASR